MSDEYKFKVGDRIKFIKGSIPYSIVAERCPGFFKNTMSSATILSMRKEEAYLDHFDRLSKLKNINFYVIDVKYRELISNRLWDMFNIHVGAYEKEIELSEDENEEDFYV